MSAPKQCPTCGKAWQLISPFNPPRPEIGAEYYVCENAHKFSYDSFAKPARVQKSNGAKAARSLAVEVAGVPTVRSLRELMARKLPEPKQAIPGLLPEGLAILAAPPKAGKSNLAHSLALAKAAGGRALGSIKVEAGEVLLIALEDSERRLQDRTRQLLGDAQTPGGLYYALTWPRFTDEGLEVLELWLASHPATSLVIFDTFGKVRGPRPKNADLFADDYAMGARLKVVADQFHICILAIHHTRKMKSDDWVSDISGTFGLTAAADTLLGLVRERGRADAVLHVTGRDLADAEYALKFDSTIGWVLVGNADEFRIGAERAAVLNVFTGESEVLQPRDVAGALGRKETSVRWLMRQMAQDGELLSVSYGKYQLSQHSQQYKHHQQSHQLEVVGGVGSVGTVGGVCDLAKKPLPESPELEAGGAGLDAEVPAEQASPMPGTGKP